MTRDFNFDRAAHCLPRPLWVLRRVHRQQLVRLLWLSTLPLTRMGSPRSHDPPASRLSPFTSRLPQIRRPQPPRRRLQGTTIIPSPLTRRSLNPSSLTGPRRLRPSTRTQRLSSRQCPRFTSPRTNATCHFLKREMISRKLAAARLL